MWVSDYGSHSYFFDFSDVTLMMIYIEDLTGVTSNWGYRDKENEEKLKKIDDKDENEKCYLVIKVREVRIVKDVKRSGGLFRLWRYFSHYVDFDHRSYFVTQWQMPKRELVIFLFCLHWKYETSNNFHILVIPNQHILNNKKRICYH